MDVEYYRISRFSDQGLYWLDFAEFRSIKMASQAARAICMWGRDAGRAVQCLEEARSEDHWITKNPVRDTARAVYALQQCGISCKSAKRWLLDQQSGTGSWNNDVYDTCYALISLDKNSPGVDWLMGNISDNWMHPGTIALINIALIHQDPKGLAGPIKSNVQWLLAQGQDGHWKYTVTSCIVVQSLILAGMTDLALRSVDWLLDIMENNEWTVPEVSQVLITLKMFHDRSGGLL